MHAESKAIRKHVRKLILVREIAASHRLEEINHLRLRKKLAAWRGYYGFDRIGVHDEWLRQHRSQGTVCLIDDPKHYQINVYFDP